MKTRNGIKYIFYIKETQEEKNIHKENYEFNVIKGVAGRKALLTYTNDYKNGLPEQLRFRTIDASGTLTVEDTLILPYIAQDCGIKDIIYNDLENNIYITGLLFKKINNRKWEFVHSFIGCYDIKKRKYTEVAGDFPSLQNYEFQWCFTNEELVLSGLQIAPYDSTGWKTSFISIDTKTLKLKDKFETKLDENLISKYRCNNQKVNNNFLEATDILKDTLGNFHTLWTYYVTADNNFQNDPHNRLGWRIAIGLFSLPGLAIALAATAPSNTNTASLLWTTKMTDTVMTSNCYVSKLRKNAGCLNSFDAINIDDRTYFISNNSSNIKHVPASTSLNYYDGTSFFNDSLMTQYLNSISHLLIFPWSEYKTNDKYYFLGQSVCENTTKREMNKKSSIVYLICIE